MRTKHSVTTAVVAKHPSGAVRLPRVHLDDHSLTVPHEVALHLLARDLHPGVDRWGRQAGLPSELEETLFELTLVRSSPGPSTSSGARRRAAPGCALRRSSSSPTARMSRTPSISPRLQALSRTFGGAVAATDRSVAGTLVHAIPSTLTRS